MDSFFSFDAAPSFDENGFEFMQPHSDNGNDADFLEESNPSFTPYQQHHHKMKQEVCEEAFSFATPMDLDAVPAIGMVGSNSPTLTPLQSTISSYDSIPPITAAAMRTVHQPTAAVVAAAVPPPTMGVPVPARSKASPRVVAKALTAAAVAVPAQVAMAVTVKKETPTSPSSVASTIISPSMPPLAAATPVLTSSPFTPSFTALPAMTPRSASSSVSAGSNSASNSGGSGACSDASDSDSGIDDSRPVGKKGRKRKASRGGSDEGGHLIIGDEADLDGPVDMTGVPLTGDKRQQRLQRNRASAQLSRERKKQYMKLLEKQLKEMAELNEGLTTQVGQLTAENAALKARLSKLAMRERVAARYPRNPVPSSGSSQGSMPSLMSGVNSPLQSHASESDSTFGSAPPTPAHTASGEEESEFPHAKKLKVASYSSPSGGHSGGGSRGAFNARTGMLFFTLVMSVGLFYNLVGLEPLHNGRVHSPAVLEQIEEVVVPTPSAAAGLALAPRAGRVLASITETTHTKGSTTDKHVAMVDDDDSEEVAAATAAADDAFALVPVISKAIDVYSKESRHADAATHLLGGIDSALSSHLLREVLLGGNLTRDEKSQYLFAPNAMRITRQLWAGMVNSSSATPSDFVDAHHYDEDEKQVALFDRATPRTRGVKRARGKVTAQDRLRARLPAPADLAHQQYASSDAASPDLAPLQVGDKLLLWLPLTAVAPGVTPPSGDANDTNVKSGSLVEIACHIANVRPIVLS